MPATFACGIGIDDEIGDRFALEFEDRFAVEPTTLRLERESSAELFLLDRADEAWSQNRPAVPVIGHPFLNHYEAASAPILSR